MNRCEPVWTALRFYVVVTFSWAKVFKSVWTGLNRFMVFFEQKPWNGVNRFEPVYVFTLLWHFRLLKSLNRSEPVWTGLWFRVLFEICEQKAMNRCEPVGTALRFYVVVTFSLAKVHKSVETGLNRFMVFFLAKDTNLCEPVWTGLRSYVVVAFLWAKVFKSVWTGLNRFKVLDYFFILWATSHESVWTGLNRLTFSR